jgi:hypothetical protein
MKGRRGGPMTLDDFKDFFNAHVAAIVTLGATGFLFLFVLYLVSRWLNSRGDFMFFDNVVADEDQIKQPWRDFKTLGNSLFKLRLIWDLVLFNVFLAIGVIGLAIGWADIKASLIARDLQFHGALMAAVIFCGAAALAAGLLLGIIGAVIFDIAVPVMYVRRLRAWPAIKLTWRELVQTHPGACLLFVVLIVAVRIVQGLWGGITAIAFLLVTCCCVGEILLIIPVVGSYIIAFLCLPVMTFERALKLQFVSQFGDAYRVTWRTAVRGGFPVILTPAPPPPDDTPRIL